VLSRRLADLRRCPVQGFWFFAGYENDRRGRARSAIAVYRAARAPFRSLCSPRTMICNVLFLSDVPFLLPFPPVGGRYFLVVCDRNQIRAVRGLTRDFGTGTSMGLATLLGSRYILLMRVDSLTLRRLDARTIDICPVC